LPKHKNNLTKEEIKEARRKATERLNKFLPKKKVITGSENTERSVKWK